MRATSASSRQPIESNVGPSGIVAQNGSVVVVVVVLVVVEVVVVVVVVVMVVSTATTAYTPSLPTNCMISAFGLLPRSRMDWPLPLPRFVSPTKIGCGLVIATSTIPL